MESRLLLVLVLIVLHPALFLEQLIALESTSYTINSVTSTGGADLPCFCITAVYYLKENDA